jgi:hypothetical protein
MTSPTECSINVPKMDIDIVFLLLFHTLKFKGLYNHYVLRYCSICQYL